MLVSRPLVILSYLPVIFFCYFTVGHPCHFVLVIRYFSFTCLFLFVFVIPRWSYLCYPCLVTPALSVLLLSLLRHFSFLPCYRRSIFLVNGSLVIHSYSPLLPFLLSMLTLPCYLFPCYPMLLFLVIFSLVILFPGYLRVSYPGFLFSCYPCVPGSRLFLLSVILFSLLSLSLGFLVTLRVSYPGYLCSCYPRHLSVSYPCYLFFSFPCYLPIG